jgi:hypothetical protein
MMAIRETDRSDGPWLSRRDLVETAKAASKRPRPTRFEGIRSSSGIIRRKGGRVVLDELPNERLTE